MCFGCKLLGKSSGAVKYIFLWVTMVPKYNIEFSWGLVAMVTLRRTVVLRRGNDAESEASAWVNSVYPPTLYPLQHGFTSAVRSGEYPLLKQEFLVLCYSRPLALDPGNQFANNHYLLNSFFLQLQPWFHNQTTKQTTECVLGAWKVRCSKAPPQTHTFAVSG